MPHKTKKGFTLVEVLLVLTLTGLVFVGIISGVSINVSRQRYNDSVQDFAEFLRRVYSEVTNVENSLDEIAVNNKLCTAATLTSPDMGNFKDIVDETQTENLGGRSDCVFYGKLISFGENNVGTDEENVIYVYDVIGKVYTTKDIMNSGVEVNEFGSDVTAHLYTEMADILSVTPDNAGTQCTVQPFPTNYSYRPQWEAKIETTTAGQRLRGQILIARSPANNSVHTFSRLKNNSSVIIHGQSLSKQPESGRCKSTLYARSNVKKASLYNRLTEFVPGGGKNGDEIKDINFCVASGDAGDAGITRRNIRISGDGHNSSAVRLINTDQSEADAEAEGVTGMDSTTSGESVCG